MFYLRYDDIEGLFREAAENYRINADKAFDWDKVNRSVHEPNEEKKPEGGKNKKRRFIFWFLLMFSAGLLSYNIWSIESAKTMLQQDTGRMPGLININKNNAANRKSNLVQVENNSSKKTEMNTESSIQEKSVKAFSDPATFSKREHFANAMQIKDQLPTINGDIIQQKITNADINPIPVLQENVLVKSNAHNIEKNLPAIINPINDTSSAASFQKNTFQKKVPAKFYVGAFVAPDVTFIKFQRTNGVGASFGLTGGYQLNKNLSIETGISLDTKKYYTNGEYFDKSNIPNFYNGELLSVNGNCNMFEVPVNIRYKFSSNSNSNFTAAIGTSSYFMTKESYNYSMLAWGQPVQGSYTSHPSSKNLFAVINLSAGYEKKFSNISLLIEPYYKVPVKGIGTGNLYMSSTGINLGIKKYFGKK